MSQKGINRLLGRAVISDEFKKGLMNGRRQALLNDPNYELTPDEVAALMAIEADSFVDFAVQVEGLIHQGLGAPEPAAARASAWAWQQWPRMAAASSATLHN